MEELKPGDLLLFTEAFDAYVREKNPYLRIGLDNPNQPSEGYRMLPVLTNRLGKLEDIIDWESENGRRIKDARIKSGKWTSLPIEENKYIVSIYYHELTGRKGEKGVAERGRPVFRFHPVTRASFFEKVPDWIYRDIIKACERFAVAPE